MNPVQFLPLAVKKQARAYLGCARGVVPLRPPEKPCFVILSGGRRGSHLLIDLLNSHSEFHVDGELLHQNAVPRMLAPKLYLRGCHLRHRRKVYGYKTSIGQLRMQSLDPGGFLAETVQRGGRIIYLDRTNLLRAVISREIAHIRGRHRETVENSLAGHSFHIDSRTVVSAIVQRLGVRQAETEILRDLPHCPISYEEDLLWSECHQGTCDRIFRYLDCASQSVKTTQARRSPADLSDVVSNFDEIAVAVRKAGLAEFLSDDEYRSRPSAAA